MTNYLKKNKKKMFSKATVLYCINVKFYRLVDCQNKKILVLVNK